MARKIRYSNPVILVIIAVFLCCIISASAAITEKSVKNLNKDENDYLIENKLVNKGNVGLTLFDGKAIIQNKSVMNQAQQNITIMETLSSDLSARRDNYNWTIRQYADYVADPSHSIQYWISSTEGRFMTASSGTLGYSATTDQIIGEKNNKYGFYLNNILLGDDEFINYPSQWRLTIYPNENKMLIQEYGYENTGITPDEEHMVTLTKMSFGRFGGKIGDRSYFAIGFHPYPEPGY
ncbi:hypothetical protein ACKUB1_10980 [Methanospirillum stamsii]|uniref:Uncharacterized protein n=1 Tax=Methanospirillum stamsii TaxID=1277351 RepID=A0A2V2N5J7_9EURY|nr:hypothetical protein [Methanospirillum stamsii]PWR75089.1 hypothetical protein DLD82_06375 [Methanospirillum stamsii]